LYRASGGRFEDGTFSPTPATEFFMAMFDPCVNAFFADTAAMNIAVVTDTVSYTDVIVESWCEDGLLAPIQYCKYHFKFRFCKEEEAEDGEEW
jgi:hypothetical protein